MVYISSNDKPMGENLLGRILINIILSVLMVSLFSNVQVYGEANMAMTIIMMIMMIMMNMKTKKMMYMQ